MGNISSRASSDATINITAQRIILSFAHLLDWTLCQQEGWSDRTMMRWKPQNGFTWEAGKIFEV